MISNGFYTERGLARLAGVSQPQIHNILKGARTLTPETADLLMETVHIALLDLVRPEELLAFSKLESQLYARLVDVPRKGMQTESRLETKTGLSEAS